MKAQKVGFPRGKELNGPSKGDGNVENKPKKKFNLFWSEAKPKLDEGSSKKKKTSKGLSNEEIKTLGGKKQADKESFSVVPLSYDQLVPGMLSLGIITKVRETGLTVSLPGRTSGQVDITGISSAFDDLLEKTLQDQNSSQDKDPDYGLGSMFRVGQQVVVKVKQVIPENDKTKVTLSINPKDIYENFSTTVLKENLVMVAAVASKEEHGYTMDVGINGARCFLPNNDANSYVKKFNFQRPLKIGQLVYCKIKRIQIHRLIATITFTCTSNAIQNQKMDDVFGMNYNTLIPGMLVDTIVMETHKTGCLVHCIDLNALVHQDHMKDEWTTPESLTVGSTIPAYVLYTLPNLTTPYLTYQPNITPLGQFKNRCDRSLLGTELEANVVRFEKRGIVIRFQGNKGIIPVTHLPDPTLSTDVISKKYKTNSVHTCRILQYSPIDQMYVCSMRTDVLKSGVVHIQQATPGKVVACTVKQWNKGGATVQLGFGMHGFIPHILFKPKLISESAKAKMVGSEIKARIMDRNIDLDRVVLTARHELVSSPCVVISAAEDAVPGSVGDGIIKNFNQVGAYVTTIGGVEGFIPKSKLSKVSLKDFKDAFHVGQVIRYKVLGRDPKENNILMTANLDEDVDPTQIVKPSLKSKAPRSEPTDSVPDPEYTTAKKKKRRKRESSKKSAEKELAKKSKTSKKTKKTKKKAKLSKEETPIQEQPDEKNVEIKEEADEEEPIGLELPDDASFWHVDVKEEDTSDSEPELESRKSKKRKMETSDSSTTVGTVDTEGTTVAESSKFSKLAEKFENGTVDEPNNPSMWIQIMTHYNSVGNLDKARGVAKHALDVINYRDDAGKLKIWGALFKLELQYGTEDTVAKVSAEALQRTDPYECLKLMALVYDQANRWKDAEHTYRQLVKQFRLEYDAWVRFGTFFYLRKKADSGREILNEAMPIVPATNQVLLISKFALLELHHGDRTRGVSMLDRVLQQYPQRVDLWLLYANALIKLEDFESARSVFHRAFDISWKPRKVKPLLQRFQAFEEMHGSADTQAEFQKFALKVLNVTPE